jgi:LPXTG-motif cell wall-anchored protein
VSRTGFETSISIESNKLSQYLAVAATTKDGKVLGVSDIFYSNGTATGIKSSKEGNSGTGSHHTATGAGAVVGGVVGAIIVALGAFYLYRRRKSKAVKPVKYDPVPQEVEQSAGQYI